MAAPFVPSMINALDIEKSVGTDAVNQPEDMSAIKIMLNGVLLTDGGTEGALDENDTATSGPEFERLEFAIIRFQSIHFAGEFAPDGRIEPGRKTIRRLRVLFAQQRVPVPQVIGITPLIPPTGDTDTLGFSAARLTRSKPRDDWLARDPALPVAQMVPVFGTRTLVLVLATTLMPTFRIEDERLAIVKNVVFNMVTIEGRMQGETLLKCFIGAFLAATVRLIVRNPAFKFIDVVHLGAPQNANEPRAFLMTILPEINNIFEPQANVTFLPGDTRSVTAATFNGTPFAIQPGEYFILSETEAAPPGAQASRFSDLQFLVRDNNAVTMFISPHLRNLLPTVGGAAESAPSNKCWVRLGGGIQVNPFITPAHELGHAIGLSHILTGPDLDYLMRDGQKVFSRVEKIPAETLVDLAVN